MHVIHVAKNALEAHFVCALLADEGIDSVVMNDMLQVAQGDFGLAPAVAPQVVVLDPRHAERARQLVDEMRARAAAEPMERTAWACSACGEGNETEFEICWQCQTPRPALAEHGRDRASRAT